MSLSLPCCAVLHCAMLCYDVLYFVVLCRTVLCFLASSLKALIDRISSSIWHIDAINFTLNRCLPLDEGTQAGRYDEKHPDDND